jgi:hypothetical protein
MGYLHFVYLHPADSLSHLTLQAERSRIDAVRVGRNSGPYLASKYNLMVGLASIRSWATWADRNGCLQSRAPTVGATGPDNTTAVCTAPGTF